MYLFLVLLALLVVIFYFGRNKALQIINHKLPCLPNYYGWHGVLIVFLPLLFLQIVWLCLQTVLVETIAINNLAFNLLSDSKLTNLLQETLYLLDNLDYKAIISDQSTTPDYLLAKEIIQVESFTDKIFYMLMSINMAGFSFYALWRISHKFNAQHSVEKMLIMICMFCASIAVLTTVGIVFSLIIETVRFFQLVSITEFLFGVQWDPQSSGTENNSGSFGIIPVLLGTMLISCIALIFAIPIGLTIAIYMSEYLSRRKRAIFKPLLEILAGIPTVVYGFFAILVIAPLIRDAGEYIGLDIVTESALAAGLVIGIMLVPFISSLSDDVISAVPDNLRQASIGMGATVSETALRVVVPAALPGIIASFLLAISRAIGETMIVVMAAGLAAKLTINPLESVTTMTVQMVQMLVGDQEFDSAKTLSAFALGMTLFIITLLLNLTSLFVVNKYRNKYD